VLTHSQKTILVTSDLRAVQHILSHPEQFQRTAFAQRYLNGSLGYGLLAAAGAAHRAQRRVINPAFGPTQIRELTGIFLDKANKVSS
jgi:cytochrome P450